MMPDEGTYENSAFNIAIKRSVVQNAETVILLVDSSKLGKKALHHVVGIDDVDAIFTEKAPLEEQAARLRQNGVAIHLA
jgi:DeoR/GlpR family transcriptional regulator of sugar metabolism